MHNNLDIRTCAVWLHFTNTDPTRVRLWSQILRCRERDINYLLDCIKFIENPKVGTKNNDTLLRVIYNELKDLPVESIKKIFYDIRTNGEDDEAHTMDMYDQGYKS